MSNRPTVSTTFPSVSPAPTKARHNRERSFAECFLSHPRGVTISAMNDVPWGVWLVALLSAAGVAGAQNFDLVGFASLNGGTTGGGAGPHVQVSTLADLVKY